MKEKLVEKEQIKSDLELKVSDIEASLKFNNESTISKDIYDGIADEKQKLALQLDVVNKKLLDSESDVAKLNATIDGYSELEKDKHFLEEKVEEDKVILQNKDNELKLLRGENTRAYEEIDILKSEVVCLKSDNQEIKNELSSKLNTLEINSKYVQSMNKELESNLQSLGKELEQEKSKCDDLERQLQTLKDENINISEEK